MSLPERIQCEQDIDDVYAHFEHEANHYVLKRLRREDTQGFRGRFFVDARDPRLITADEIKELKRYLNDGADDFLWMRGALNAVQDLAKLVGLERADRWINTPLVVNKHVRCSLSDLVYSLQFYAPVVEAVDLWRRYHNVFAEAFKNGPSDWFTEPLAELDGKPPTAFLEDSVGIARLETLLGIGASP